VVAEPTHWAPMPPDLLDALTTAVLIVDARGAIHFLNNAAQSLLAVGRAQARGRLLAELVRDAAPLEAVIHRALQQGEPIANREIPMTPVLRSDVQFTVDCTAAPYGEELALVEISDTTRQQRITRDNALLTQLGGSRLMARQLAHEIKNPLGGLRGAAQLLERELSDSAQREYTQVIIREADRLRALVDNLLGPHTPPRKETVNLHELTQHVFHLVRSEAPAGIAVLRDYDPSLPPLALDRDQVIQACLNLARNAVQVLGQTGRLTIRTRAMTNVTIGAQRHRVVAAVSFEDNGPGVPADLKDTLFYPLVTGRVGGTGLGLAVAQDLVTRHGGLIEFESRPGHTVFTVLLPISNGKGA
jgi:two-component system, NtrC family, nitrogen regulation sensor histidine kinase GlnL